MSAREALGALLMAATGLGIYWFLGRWHDGEAPPADDTPLHRDARESGPPAERGPRG